MPRDDRGCAPPRGPTDQSPLDYLRAAGFNREQSAPALPAALALSAASSMDLGRVAAAATKMVILMRKIEAISSARYGITFVP